MTRRGASLIFTDESGFLLLPLVRRTLAVQGRTPVLRHRARQRDKVSVAAALTLSPARGHVSLYYQTYPNQYVNGVTYAQFLRRTVLPRVPANRPVVLVHDGGSMHKGDDLRAVRRMSAAGRGPAAAVRAGTQSGGGVVEFREGQGAEQLRPAGRAAIERDG